MLETIIGVVAGVIGGLGMGGGTVLILFLSLFLGIEQHIAQATNIIFFIPTAIAAIIISFKNKNINLKLALPICLWGCIGAAAGAFISSKMDMTILRKAFAIFLIIIAIYQTYSIYQEYRKSKKSHTSNKYQKGG